MPAKQRPEAATVEAESGKSEPLHKTTINFPESLYQDLKLLSAIEPNGSFNGILERAARELVARERETIDQLKHIASKHQGIKGKR